MNNYTCQVVDYMYYKKKKEQWVLRSIINNEAITCIIIDLHSNIYCFYPSLLTRGLNVITSCVTRSQLSILRIGIQFWACHFQWWAFIFAISRSTYAMKDVILTWSLYNLESVLVCCLVCMTAEPQGHHWVIAMKVLIYNGESVADV